MALHRRCALVASAIALIVLAACAPAWAGEPEPAAPDTTALARLAIAEARFDDALRLLGRSSAPDHSDDERMAAAEIGSVVEGWVSLRRTVFPRAIGIARGEREAAGGGSTEVAVGPGWETGFAVARAQLVAGDFDLAGPNFATLQATARDRREALRARALGSLARDLATKALVLGWTEPRTAARPHSRGETEWYGWQTLIADGVSILVVPLVGSQLDSDGGKVALATVGSYLLAPGIIHLAHGRPGIAAASVGLRLGLPLGASVLGYGVSKLGCRGSYCGLDGAAVGLVLGAIGAIVIDAAVFSRERVEDGEASSRQATATPPRRDVITFVPLAGPRKEGGFDVGLGAIF